KSTVPIILSINFSSRKARRQRAAGQDMLRSYAMGGGVEIGKASSTDIDGADAEAHVSCIDPVEIHQTLEYSLKRRRIIVAVLVRGARGPQCRRWHTRNKKIRGPKQEDVHSPYLIDKVMHKRIWKFNRFGIWDAYRRRTDGLPKFAQPIHALVRGVSGDDC